MELELISTVPEYVSGCSSGPSEMILFCVEFVLAVNLGKCLTLESMRFEVRCVKKCQEGEVYVCVGEGGAISRMVFFGFPVPIAQANGKNHKGGKS